jgi:Hemerythrin HHE cation binding domain
MALIDPLEPLLAPQRALRNRFEDFRQALGRRQMAAVEVAFLDFCRQLERWTAEEERVLLPAVARATIPGRDPQRELRLEYVQLRELTRFVLRQILEAAPIADVLGFVENLERRLTAHESQMSEVYYPAVAGILLPSERRALEEAAPPP